jgi:hypothetical protein
MLKSRMASATSSIKGIVYSHDNTLPSTLMITFRVLEISTDKTKPKAKTLLQFLLKRAVSLSLSLSLSLCYCIAWLSKNFVI